MTATADLGRAIDRDPDHGRLMTRKDALRLLALESEFDDHPTRLRASRPWRTRPEGSAPARRAAQLARLLLQPAGRLTEAA